MSTTRTPRATLSAAPVDGIIYRELLDGLTLAEIAERYECEIAILRRRVHDKAAIWRRRPPRFLRPAPGKLIVPTYRYRGGSLRRGEISVPAVTMHVRQIEEKRS